MCHGEEGPRCAWSLKRPVVSVSVTSGRLEHAHGAGCRKHRAARAQSGVLPATPWLDRKSGAAAQQLRLSGLRWCLKFRLEPHEGTQENPGCVCTRGTGVLFWRGEIQHYNRKFGFASFRGFTIPGNSRFNKRCESLSVVCFSRQTRRKTPRR